MMLGPRRGYLGQDHRGVAALGGAPSSARGAGRHVPTGRHRQLVALGHRRCGGPIRAVAPAAAEAAAAEVMACGRYHVVYQVDFGVACMALGAGCLVVGWNARRSAK